MTWSGWLLAPTFSTYRPVAALDPIPWVLVADLEREAKSVEHELMWMERCFTVDKATMVKEGRQLQWLWWPSWATLPSFTLMVETMRASTLWPIWPHLKHAPGSPAYFVVCQYHGMIPCKKNRLPMSGRRVKQEHWKIAQPGNGLGVRPTRHVKYVTCHNIFSISSAFHHRSELEDIFIIFSIEAVVRCWCYWRRNFEFLLHFLADIVPESFIILSLIYSQYLLWINRPMPPVREGHLIVNRGVHFLNIS